GWATMSTGLPNSGDYIENGVADLNGDGHLDIVATGGFETTFGIHVYHGNGQGTWSESSPGLPDTEYYVGLDIGDVDGEGNPDLAAGKMTGGGGVEVWMNPRGPKPGLSARLRTPSEGTSLSGGSEHSVRWSVSSGTPPYSVSLSYSTDGGASYGNIIATDIHQAGTGDGSYRWTVPEVDEGRVRLRVQVSDGNSITASATSQGDLEIDSTAPMVLSTAPSDGASDVPIDGLLAITFDEGMNRSRENAVSIAGPGSPMLRLPSWSDETVTFQTKGLEHVSTYTVTVSAQAVDDSVPGNPLAVAHTFTFETGAPEDLAPPVADGGPDMVVDQGSLVTFDGTASSDDVGIVNWTWRFFYDGELVSIYGDTASFLFDIPESYDVTLTVRDAVGKAGTATVGLRVKDTEPPVVVLEPISDPTEGERVTLDASASTDNVGIVGWNWTITHDGSTKVLQGAVVRYTFETPGNYRVTVEVTDAEGLTATDGFSVTVDEGPSPQGSIIYITLAIVVVVIIAAVVLRRR
ncbi:MAG: Ig-like domain-containing protein, partial [Thermoplasmata archaeon]